MTKRVFLIRGLSTDPQTEQNNKVGKEVGDGVDRISYEGLALAEYAGQKLE
jgi:hypothetical protein